MIQRRKRNEYRYEFTVSQIRGETAGAGSAVQILLLARGDDPQKVDANFGDNTLIAVKQFQKDIGLAADGVAGFDTIRKLLFVI